jgi:CheY-like chemotaxis protein
MARPLIDQRRQALTVLVPPEGICLQADPHRLTQVIANLLTNAAKFTPAGGRITVITEQEGAEAVIRVRDTGKGIPAEMLPQVFDLFTQVNPSIDRAEGGLGLGLTLVRKLVEMHGGRVEAHSAGPGLGSEFVVCLPAYSLADRAGAAGSDTPSGLRILVVDDNQDAADTLSDLLSLWGHEVRVAYTGLDALAITREYRPDAVLLDIGLPGLDGYEVAREIRGDASLSGIRLLAITGYGQDEDRERSLAAGFNEHLTKPVDPQALERLLRVE